MAGQQNVAWMPAPSGGTGIPPGLEYLTQLDQLLVHQVIELLEAFTGYETENKYVIKNSMGQQVYYAMESSGFCCRLCCGPRRTFSITIVDNTNRPVMRVERKFKCCAGCCWIACCNCTAHSIVVEAPPGTVIGHVVQTCSKWKAHYDIQDANENTILHVVGPCCVCPGGWCWDQEFAVKTADKSTQIGKISKQFSGFVQEMFTTADNFGVSFPKDLDVNAKACLMACTLLIDFMFYEEKDDK